MAGIRFFKMSYCDINRAETVSTLDNNGANLSMVIGRPDIGRWSSIGSNDTNTITYTCQFQRDRVIDSVFLLNSNLKEFTLEGQWNGGGWSTLINETNNSVVDYFQAISPATVDEIRLKMKKTMTADAEKRLGQFIVTQAIGQLDGYPILEVNPSKNTTAKTMMNGKKRVVYGGKSTDFRMKFQSHVGENDRDLFRVLYNHPEPFLMWPNAGSSDQFAHLDEGYRRGDVYLVTPNGEYTHGFEKNLFFSGMNAELNLVEVA